MPALYLTPAALSYLSQFILALLIAGYFTARLLRPRAHRPAQGSLLTGFLACIALVILLLTLEALLPLYQRLYALYPQTTVLALGILLLLQFAYRFPTTWPRRWEVHLALALSLLYLGYEGLFAIHRFRLLAEGTAIYRINWADYPMVAGLLWAPVVLLRQAVAASNPSGLRDRKGFAQALIHPQGQAARTARALALVYVMPFGIVLLNVLRSFYSIPPELLQIGRSLGIMLALGLFAVLYLNYLPETTSFMVRLVGATLVTLLTVLAAVGWLTTPAYAAQYYPALPDQRTLRFTPNQTGGYDVSLAPLRFERDPSAGSPQKTQDYAGQGLGADLHLVDQRTGEGYEHQGSYGHTAQLSFAFPFYGQTYEQLYVSDDGTIALGRRLDSYFSYSYHYGGGIPFLFPLFLDLNPEAGGSVFARQEADRLIVTWQRVPAFYHPEDVYTFQAVLYTSGVFEFSYDGLPAALAYLADDEPSARAWVIGAVPGATSPPTPLLAGEGSMAPPSLAAGKGVGRVGPQYVDWASLTPDRGLSSGPAGLVQDYYLDFRRHLHLLLLPLAYLLLGVSLLTVLTFPSLFRLNLVKPLETLLAGMRRANAGDLDATTPVQFRDEIGFLTESFNTMTESLRTERDELQKTAEALRGLSATLETRVAERTADLAQANTRLHAEIAERQAAQAQVVVQERALAAAEEREHLGRELHDGLGQVMGYLNVQAQTVEVLLDQGKLEGARTNLRQMAHAAQQGHADLRSFILGFRAAARRSFGEALQGAMAGFERQAALPVALEMAQPWDEHWLSPVAEVHLLRIIQEALTNSARHARAQHVTLTLAQAGDRLRVMVADDGVGFRIADCGLPIADDETSIANRESAIENPQSAIGNHFGLATMRERAAELCGALTLESAPGRGTRIILEIPIQAPCPPSAAPTHAQRVLLVDDHPMFLDGLHNLLTAHGMEVVGLGQDGFEAQTLARTLRPDLIVMDLQMPGCDGLEATRRIKAEWPEARIVILTVSASEEHLFAALQAGAAGYLLKSLNAEEFFLLLAGLEQGAPPIAPALAARIRGALGQAASQRGQAAALNPEQTNILRLVADGLTYREVGRQLHLSEAAVKYQMKQILERLHLANRAQAEAYARRSGLGGDAVRG